MVTAATANLDPVY